MWPDRIEAPVNQGGLRVDRRWVLTLKPSIAQPTPHLLGIAVVGRARGSEHHPTDKHDGCKDERCEDQEQRSIPPRCVVSIGVIGQLRLLLLDHQSCIDDGLDV